MCGEEYKCNMVYLWHVQLLDPLVSSANQWVRPLGFIAVCNWPELVKKNLAPFTNPRSIWYRLDWWIAKIITKMLELTPDTKTTVRNSSWSSPRIVRKYHPLKTVTNAFLPYSAFPRSSEDYHTFYTCPTFQEGNPTTTIYISKVTRNMCPNRIFFL